MIDLLIIFLIIIAGILMHIGIIVVGYSIKQVCECGFDYLLVVLFILYGLMIFAVIIFDIIIIMGFVL